MGSFFIYIIVCIQYANPLVQYIFIAVLGWGWGSAPCALQRFLQFLKILKVRTHGWMQNWILLHIKKKVFQCFELVWLISFQKVLIWPPQKFFPNIFNMGIKKHRIWCRLRIRWKSIKKVFTKKVRGLRTFVHSTKRWKMKRYMLYANMTPKIFVTNICNKDLMPISNLLKKHQES
jgi:hypothetical protein